MELFTRLSPMEGGWGGGGEGVHLFYSDYLQIVKTDEQCKKFIYFFFFEKLIHVTNRVKREKTDIFVINRVKVSQPGQHIST